RGLVVDCELGEHAAVDLDLGGAQALDEPVVGHPVRAGTGVDALDPETTEVALLGAAVTVAVLQRVGDLLPGLAVEAGPLAPVAAGALEDDPALLVGVDRPLHACHVSTPSGVVGEGLGSATEQLLDLLLVGLGDHDVVREAPRVLRGLLVELVDMVRPLTHDLPRAGDPEALLRTTVRLVLRHGADLLLVACWSVPAVPVTTLPRSRRRRPPPDRRP